MEQQSPLAGGGRCARTACATTPVNGYPKSFNASKDRMAHAAGIIFDPGKPTRARIMSIWVGTKYGRNRNKPPNLVGKLRGVRSSWRTSATSATTGLVFVGRSASRRHGSLAKPFSFKILAIAAGLRDSSSLASGRLMS
jgi:hypothetical protein